MSRRGTYDLAVDVAADTRSLATATRVLFWGTLAVVVSHVIGTVVVLIGIVLLVRGLDRRTPSVGVLAALAVAAPAMALVRQAGGPRWSAVATTLLEIGGALALGYVMRMTFAASGRTALTALWGRTFHAVLWLGMAPYLAVTIALRDRARPVALVRWDGPLPVRFVLVLCGTVALAHLLNALWRTASVVAAEQGAAAPRE